ncbi:hypothetical protein E1N52_35935 [Paraburkholderia guartelaensis]|uniref:Uncharacterized protein n=1 Tax=Paraburkholderia guartelaensis TaxID=2546446 RepID=A0A4R5L4J7_9BURK|nr:hypothetical protein [Paraburkholderia guartelaensis]TDG03146.1 hypothetical protein E1N52_35935 [Paraburkholderia guartelaensis]
MKRASLIAFVLSAAYLAAPLSPAHADTHYEGHVQAYVAPKAPAPANPPGAASAVNTASVAHAASEAKLAAAPAKKRRAAPTAPAPRPRVPTPDDSPFAFRGIPLGTPLSALRQTDMVRATPHESELLCETDIAGSDIGMMVKSYTSLTVACRWAHHTAQGWAPSRAVVDGVPAVDHILRFAHTSAGDPLRLYEMSFVVDSTTALDLRNLLASRYGAPHVLGAPSLPLLVWENASSTITICLLPDSQRATLTYLLKPAMLRAKASDKTLKLSQFDEG